MPADEHASPSGRRRRGDVPASRPSHGPDPLDADFGPGPAAGGPDDPPVPEDGPDDGEAGEPRRAPVENPPPPYSGGIFPGVACAGDACLLKPVANLFGRFGVRLSRGHGASLSRVAFSGIELMRALRDFLDEEIALAEKAARAGGGASPRYEKIRVD